MNREEMLEQLGQLPHPITEGLVVFDDGCEFSILTSTEGFSCGVGGAFPINGPLELSPILHADLMRVLPIQYPGGLEEAIEAQIPDQIRRDSLLEVLRVIGDGAAKGFYRLNWPANKACYVFHDMGREESALFPTLEAAYEYFLNYFARKGSGLPWKSMSDEDLAEWIILLESWHTHGSMNHPPTEWLGAYCNPHDGTAGQATLPKA